MSDAFAYLTWRCSECGSEPIEENNGLLRCETCGHEFRPVNTYHADLVPYEEDWGEDD